jgi:hypothetical protein
VLERVLPWLGKLLVILALAAVSGLLTLALLQQLASSGVRGEIWRSRELQLPGLGAVVWLAIFLFLPRPTRLYVFSHELTHALWVLMMGGRVRGFRVTSKGGHVISTKDNWLISLSPYFFPLYSIMLVVGYGVLRQFAALEGWRWLFLFLLGATWCFHLTFTVVTISRGQQDLRRHGLFFSLLIIYAVNLLVLASLLAVFADTVTFGGLLDSFLFYARNLPRPFLS